MRAEPACCVCTLARAAIRARTSGTAGVLPRDDDDAAAERVEDDAGWACSGKMTTLAASPRPTSTSTSSARTPRAAATAPIADLPASCDPALRKKGEARSREACTGSGPAVQDRPTGLIVQALGPHART
eukprot:scaffold820_cov376-Prasinococcus_capsulatus_cf.AAC.1